MNPGMPTLNAYVLAVSGTSYIGMTLHGLLFVALTAVCAFDDWRLAADWADCLIPLGLLLVPRALAAIGTPRRSSGLLTAAYVLGLLLGLISLTGPGLFVLLPAILYGVAAARGQLTAETRRCRGVSPELVMRVPEQNNQS